MESLCRICLGEGATIPIFEESYGSNHSIHDKLTLCFNDKFEKLAGYPLYLCDCCHDTLNVFYDFINTYRKTCEILEERFKVSIKKELIYCDDHDPFDSELTKEQIKEEFKNETHVVIGVEALCNKTIKRRTTKKGINNKKLENAKQSNKITKNKIIKRESSTLDISRPLKSSPMKTPKHIPCETCGAKFKNRENLKFHVELKHNNLKLICDICNATFSSKNDLARHIKRIHSDDRDFICSKCGKGFAFLADLNIHTKGVHEKALQRKNPKKLPCKVCDKEYISKTLLLIHERSAHTGERPAICTVCNKSFFHEDYLKQHMRLHTGERPYECPVCGSGYAQLGNMKSHMRNHRISELSQETLSKIKTSWHKFMRE